MKGAYYNENDSFAAAWLRELIKEGLIADGEVDERDIRDVQADDVRGFTQCHFFAGIGGWSYALRLAGWPDDRLVWTGSCPCQPFSSAGSGNGENDERDLWPVWFPLIRECRPSVVFGEQVARAAGLQWLDRLCDDLEDQAYAVGAADLCAASVGAFHIRQRLFFVADSESRDGGLPIQQRRSLKEGSEFERRGQISRVGNTECDGRQGGVQQAIQRAWWGQERRAVECSSLSPWSDVEWLECRDGKTRAVEPGTFPLAYGVPGYVGMLRAYGNAIVPQVAQAFIESYLEAVGDICPS